MENEEDLVSEAWVDYSTHSKSQFLDDLEKRLKLFMLRCVKLCRTLPKYYEAQHFAHQLICSSSSSALTSEPFEEQEVKKNTSLSLVLRSKN